jgi:quercetin dioxygenase-like cupin family protein
MTSDTRVAELDYRPALGLRCLVTAPAESTAGAYVEMDVTAQPGMGTIVHEHPEADETYQVLSGTLEVLFQGAWRALRAGESFAVTRGEVHAFRVPAGEPVRFINRHTPALGFQAHMEAVHRLVRAGKVRGPNDPRSVIYMAMAAAKHRPDVAVKPPQWLVNLLAGLGRRLGWTLE